MPDPQQVDVAALMAEGKAQHEAMAAQGFTHSMANGEAVLQEEAAPDPKGEREKRLAEIAQHFSAKLYGGPVGDHAEQPQERPNAKPQLPSLSPEEEPLFGPTSRPDEPITAGLNRVSPGQVPLPPQILSKLGILTRMAKEPDAPPQLALLISSLAHFSEK